VDAEAHACLEAYESQCEGSDIWECGDKGLVGEEVEDWSENDAENYEKDGTGRRIFLDMASPMKLIAMIAATIEKVIMTSLMKGSQSI
jgi:hypothetical protein